MFELIFRHSFLSKADAKEMSPLLKEKCFQNVGDRYKIPEPIVLERLNRELSDIERVGWSSYILEVANIMELARAKGMVFGPGCGSVTGSLVSYVLGITDVDPLRYGLIFERFLSRSQSNLRGIKLDICLDQFSNFVALLVAEYGGHDPDFNCASELQVQALKELCIIHRTLRNIERNSGKSISINTIPLDDVKVFELLGNGSTEHVFMFDSPGFTDLFMRLKPDSLNDLIAMVCLYRPGPLAAGYLDEYLERKAGADWGKYPYKVLEAVLEDTYGIFVYQEQVTEAIQRITDCTYSDAEKNPVLNEGRSQGGDDLLRGMFHRKAVSNESLREVTSEKDARDLFSLLCKKSRDSFLKAHAVPYALISYRMAWLKVHFSSEFTKACEVGKIE